MKGILIVSFGTIFQETKKKNIDAIQADVEKLGFQTYTAFTSDVIIQKLAVEGVIINDVETALIQMRKNDILDVVILPTHLLYGYEYEKIFQCVENSKKMFNSMKIATPLLASTEDMLEFINILATEIPQLPNRALVMVGHGTKHYSNAIYPALDYMAKQQNQPHIFITTIENYPNIDVVLDLLKKTDYTDVLITPLMLVAGNHAINDMASDEPESLKSILIDNGFAVEDLVKGLGEYKGVRDLYIKHLKEIL